MALRPRSEPTPPPQWVAAGAPMKPFASPHWWIKETGDREQMILDSLRRAYAEAYARGGSQGAGIRTPQMSDVPRPSRGFVAEIQDLLRKRR